MKKLLQICLIFLSSFLFYDVVFAYGEQIEPIKNLTDIYFYKKNITTTTALNNARQYITNNCSSYDSYAIYSTNTSANLNKIHFYCFNKADLKDDFLKSEVSLNRDSTYYYANHRYLDNSNFKSNVTYKYGVYSSMSSTSPTVSTKNSNSNSLDWETPVPLSYNEFILPYLESNLEIRIYYKPHTVSSKIAYNTVIKNDVIYNEDDYFMVYSDKSFYIPNVPEYLDTSIFYSPYLDTEYLNIFYSDCSNILESGSLDFKIVLDSYNTPFQSNLSFPRLRLLGLENVTSDIYKFSEIDREDFYYIYDEKIEYKSDTLIELTFRLKINPVACYYKYININLDIGSLAAPIDGYSIGNYVEVYTNYENVSFWLRPKPIFEYDIYFNTGFDNTSYYYFESLIENSNNTLVYFSEQIDLGIWNFTGSQPLLRKVFNFEEDVYSNYIYNLLFEKNYVTAFSKNTTSYLFYVHPDFNVKIKKRGENFIVNGEEIIDKTIDIIDISSSSDVSSLLDFISNYFNESAETIDYISLVVTTFFAKIPFWLNSLFVIMWLFLHLKVTMIMGGWK